MAGGVVQAGIGHVALLKGTCKPVLTQTLLLGHGSLCPVLSHRAPHNLLRQITIPVGGPSATTAHQRRPVLLRRCYPCW